MSGFRVGFAVGNKDMIQAKKYQTHTNRYVWCPSRCEHTHLITMMTF